MFLLSHVTETAHTFKAYPTFACWSGPTHKMADLVSSFDPFQVAHLAGEAWIRRQENNDARCWGGIGREVQP